MIPALCFRYPAAEVCVQLIESKSALDFEKQ